MSTPALRFGDTANSLRLAYFDQMLDTIATARDVRQLHRSLVEIMRRMFGVSCYVEVTTEELPPLHYRVTRVWREDGTEGVPDCSPWRGQGVPVRAGGIIGQVIARAKPSFVADLSFPADDPLFVELGQYHALAATPGALGQRDHWVFVFDTCAGEVSSATLEYLILRVMLIGSALRNLRTAVERDDAYHKLSDATAFIQGEVDRIAAIQQSLLPPPRPNVPGLEVAAWSQTSNRAGGDLYEYVPLANGEWALLIADASGHGPSAAVVSAMLSTMLHTFLQSPLFPLMSPARILTLANEHLANRQIEQSFVTAFLTIWNPAANKLTYSCAGHNPPLFRRETNGSVTELSAASGLPLGLFPHTEYDQQELELRPGDVVLMFSDGIVEAETAAGEPFEVQRLHEALVQTTNRSADEILMAIKSSIRAHQDGIQPSDDQTLLILRAV
jgi:phosphoserine phosphatase RsbU/P